MEIESEDFNLDQKKQVQLQLYQALSVLGIKVSTFHSNCTKGKKDEARKLLEEALLDRTMEAKKQVKSGPKFNPNLQVADLPTIHEAYQFLMRRYVDGNALIDPFAKVPSGKNSRKNSLVEPLNFRSSRKNSLVEPPSSAKGSRKNSFSGIPPDPRTRNRRNSDSAIDFPPQIKVTGTLRKKSM